MSLRIALLTEVFHGPGFQERLRTRLRESRAGGAALAILPEIPLDPWCPASAQSREEDAEEPGGRRLTALRSVAAEVGIAVLGGGIVRDPERHNTAWLVDEAGSLLSRYEKIHLPDEPGFHEVNHYVPGRFPPSVVSVAGFPVGVQICSDANRPQGTHILAAAGALAVLVPRATEAATWPRWETVFRASALTACAYVVSVNRPGPEAGVGIGGPSVVIAPTGESVVETTEALAFADLESAVVAEARRAYPGYLPVRADVYRDGWAAVTGLA